MAALIGLGEYIRERNGATLPENGRWFIELIWSFCLVGEGKKAIYTHLSIKLK